MTPRLDIKKLTVQDILHAYGVSRATVEKLILQGFLTPQRIIGSPTGKRFFDPEQVDRCFKTYHFSEQINVQEIYNETTAQVCDGPPKSARLH